MFPAISSTIQPMATVKVKRKLTIKQLDEALSYFPRMKPETKEACRLVLVEGKTNQVAADQVGKHKQFVHNKVIEVYDTYMLKVAKRPAGWVKKEWSFPPEMIKEIDALEEKMLKEHLSKNKKM